MVMPVSFKVAHELRGAESDPKLADLVAQLDECVEFDGRRVLYQWIGGTRSDWRGQGHFRALTEEQESWAHRQRLRRDCRQDQEPVLRDAQHARPAQFRRDPLRAAPGRHPRVEGLPEQAARASTCSTRTAAAGLSRARSDRRDRAGLDSGRSARSPPTRTSAIPVGCATGTCSSPKADWSSSACWRSARYADRSLLVTPTAASALAILLEQVRVPVLVGSARHHPARDRIRLPSRLPGARTPRAAGGAGMDRAGRRSRSGARARRRCQS